MDWGTVTGAVTGVVSVMSAIILPPVRKLVSTTYQVKEDLSAHEAADNMYQQNVNLQLKEIKEVNEKIYDYLLNHPRR